MAQRILSLLAIAAVPATASLSQVVAMGPNPIRKVTAVLEKMQAKVTKEGEDEAKLFDKFECHCKTEGGALKRSIADREKRFPNLDADLKASEQQKVQLEKEIQQAKADKAAAEKAIEEAAALREKEAQVFAKDAGEQDKSIKALKKAVTALESGVGAKASLLQTGEINALHKLTLNQENMEDSAREVILAFLESNEHYNPASGEIIGILKQMGDEMQKDLEKLQGQEQTALKAFNSMTDAKSKEIKALVTASESKQTRVGELALSIIQIKNDIADGARILDEDKKFYADLVQGCETKAKEYQEGVKLRNKELKALADTIKLLTSDDALDIFKKSLGKKAKPSFLQISSVNTEQQKAAETILHHHQQHRYMAAEPAVLNLLTLALQGKKVGFEKVVKMVDEMVQHIQAEKVEEDKKRKYCQQQLNLNADNQKSATVLADDQQTSLESVKEKLKALVQDIKKVQLSLKKLDEDVAKSTKQRKAENAEFQDLIASNNAAIQLLNVAKERLNKFYNPALVPKEEFLQVAQAPTTTTPRPGRGAAPEAPKGYKKSDKESHGIIELLDNIVGDLEKENIQAEHQEKDAQAAYEKVLKDAAEKKNLDLGVLTEKNAFEAATRDAIQQWKTSKASTLKELEGHKKMEGALHNDCDTILRDYDTRLEERNTEIESLKRAKAILSGAKFSLRQVKAHSA